MNDTIAAISTALGIGAISIIRVSGNEAISIVNKIFKGPNLKEVNSHTIHYGYIIDDDKIIDEVLVTVMLAPRTFTTEDVVEINLHGGISTTNKVLELLLNNGCRLALPGEFTKRAFLNGRIDLVEAESVMDLINAKTDQARDIALTQLKGNVSNLIKDLRNDILDILAHIEVNIDYPEYEDIEQLTNNELKPSLTLLIDKMNKILAKSQNNIYLTKGIKTIIIGKPNVGKSSLLNKLLNEDKAIVTDIEGTTRDIVEGTINLDGILLDIIDTAGIRKTNDKVENIGVQKSLELIDKADLILFMLNMNEPLTDMDKKIIDLIKNKKYITILNKKDLPKNLFFDNINLNNIVEISIINNQGIDELSKMIKDMFLNEQIGTQDYTYLSNSRSISLLKQALSSLNESMKGINKNIPIDMIEIDLKNAWNYLGEIIGETYTDELIDQLFSQFCVGK